MVTIAEAIATLDAAARAERTARSDLRRACAKVADKITRCMPGCQHVSIVAEYASEMDHRFVARGMAKVEYQIAMLKWQGPSRTLGLTRVLCREGAALTRASAKSGVWVGPAGPVECAPDDDLLKFAAEAVQVIEAFRAIVVLGEARFQRALKHLTRSLGALRVVPGPGP